MSTPITVDIPHKLGVAGARERLDRNLGKLESFIPGGAVADKQWDGDTLSFAVEAMGQRVGTRMDVSEGNVHATFEIPPALAMFSGMIRGQLQKAGTKLLE